MNFQTYGNYSSKNYGANALSFQKGSTTVYFSYKTVVAIRDPMIGLAVIQNCWGPTTGKHLNWIDNGRKKERLDKEQFQDIVNYFNK